MPIPEGGNFTEQLEGNDHCDHCVLRQRGHIHRFILDWENQGHGVAWFRLKSSSTLLKGHFNDYNKLRSTTDVDKTRPWNSDADWSLANAISCASHGLSKRFRFVKGGFE